MNAPTFDSVFDWPPPQDLQLKIQLCAVRIPDGVTKNTLPGPPLDELLKIDNGCYMTATVDTAVGNLFVVPSHSDEPHDSVPAA